MPRTTATSARPSIPDVDVAVVIGTLSRSPESRTLPSGSTLVRYEVTSRHDAGTDTVPVSWFDPARPPRLSEGDRVAVVGRVRRRFFSAGGTTRSATEIVATGVTRAASTARLRAVLSDVLAVLGD